mgnify:CR=1 FL=1
MATDDGTTDAPQPAATPAPAPTKGGFGAFAQQYRDRWAAEHPNARPARPAGTPDAGSTDAGTPDAATPDTGSTP